ncbi:MAG: RrF2 family transcriptional regulator [Candidatus Bipolaricaulota bacterium]
MRVTKKTGYGLIAMVELANNGNRRYLSTTQVSEKYELPQPFLEKIMNELKSAGLVKVRRGREGGYGLVKGAGDIPIAEIVHILEEDSCAPVSCLNPDYDQNCPLQGRCPTERFWQLVYEKLTQTLESFTLADLAEMVEG